MKNNSKIITLTMISLVIGLVIAWLVFSGVNTTGNATKSINNSELNSTIGTIMAKGVKEGSKDDVYVKNLLINNGYSTIDGKTYINKALETKTVLCYEGDNVVGGSCGGSCSGTGGDSCFVYGCKFVEQVCKCDTFGCNSTRGNCEGSTGTVGVN